MLGTTMPESNDQFTDIQGNIFYHLLAESTGLSTPLQMKSYEFQVYTEGFSIYHSLKGVSCMYFQLKSALDSVSKIRHQTIIILVVISSSIRPNTVSLYW